MTNGHAATLDEAKAKFRAAWEKAKAGGKAVTSHLRSDVGLSKKMMGRGASFHPVLRLLCTSILMPVALPAAAEQRIILSGLTKPFPAIGDAVVGCRDPADTVHWIEIITGKIWEREIIQDGQSQTLHPSLRDVAIGVRGFFHAYISAGDCWGYGNGDEVTIEAHSRWYDIDMMCASDPTRRLLLDSIRRSLGVTTNLARSTRPRQISRSLGS